MKEIILKRAILASIMLILFASGCSQKIEKPFVSTPEKPHSGQEITVSYNPDSTPLKNSDQIEMLAYEFTLAPTPQVKEVEVTKIGESYKGTFKTDSSTLLVLMKFKSEKNDYVIYILIVFILHIFL